MGAITKILSHKACEPDVLRGWFASRCEDERAEFGYDPYSGSLGTKLGQGLEIYRTVFPSDDAAEEMLTDRADKHGPAIAAKVRQPSKATLRKLATLDAKIQRIRETTEAGAYRPKAYEQVHRDALERARNAKAKTRGCRSCGSAIATAHIRHTACPVCAHPDFVLTSADRKRIDAAMTKQEKGEAQIKDLEKQKDSLVERDKSSDYHWLIAACCPE